MSVSVSRTKRLLLELRFPAGIGLAVAILLAAGVVEYRTIQDLVETDRLVAHTVVVRAELEGTVSAVGSIESDARGYVATGDDSFVSQEQMWGSRVQEHLRQLRVLTADNPSQQRNLGQLEPLVERKLDFMHRLVTLRSQRGLDAATELIARGEGRALMSAIRAHIAAMETEESSLLAARQADSHARARRAAQVAVLGSLLALALVALAGWRNRADVAARTQAERALLRAGAYNRSLIEASLDPLITIAPNGKINDVNAATEKVTGASRQELVGTDFAGYFTEPDSARAGYQQVFREGSVLDYELEIRHRDGHTTPVLFNASVYRDENGQAAGVFAAARDISERKRAEQELMLSRERLALALRVGQAGCFDWDIQKNLNIWSPEVEALYGIEEGKFGGTYEAWEPLLLPEDLETARAGIEEALKSGEFNGEWRIRRPGDGEARWLSARAKVFFDETGRPVRMIGINSDITERKRAEIEIRKLNDELEERVAQRTAALEAANQELEGFTYSVSHDLRAPLRHVDGFSRILQEEHSRELSSEAREYVATIRESVLQMGRLIDDLLNLGRLGRTELSVQVTGLNSVVKEVVTDLRQANPHRDIEWKIQALPFVECDPPLIRQVFVNLLANAVKFSRTRKLALIEVGTCRKQDQTVVYVKDNGVGFSMKYVDKLFGIFQRLHRSEDFEGTGVGLATVQRIIRKHGGQVWAEAELNQGATFYFTLGAHAQLASENPRGDASDGRSKSELPERTNGRERIPARGPA
jgi:PAS domain S-box-containing protein